MLNSETPAIQLGRHLQQQGRTYLALFGLTVAYEAVALRLVGTLRNADWWTRSLLLASLLVGFVLLVRALYRQHHKARLWREPRWLGGLRPLMLWGLIGLLLDGLRVFADLLFRLLLVGPGLLRPMVPASIYGQPIQIFLLVVSVGLCFVCQAIELGALTVLYPRSGLVVRAVVSAAGVVLCVVGLVVNFYLQDAGGGGWLRLAGVVTFFFGTLGVLAASSAR